MLRVLMYVAVLALVTGCASSTLEPTAEQPEPTPQPSPITETTATPKPTAPPAPPTSTSPTSAPPPAPSTDGPGRQPPMANIRLDVDVQVAVHTIAALDGASAREATAYAQRALTAYGYQVQTTADGLVATRSGVPQVQAGRPWHLASARPDSPAGLGVLLTVASALASRSTHAPTVLVVGGAQAYVDGLDPALRSALLDPVELAVAPDASEAQLQREAARLVGSL